MLVDELTTAARLRRMKYDEGDFEHPSRAGHRRAKWLVAVGLVLIIVVALVV